MSSIEERLNQIIDELIASGITLDQAVEAFEGKYIAAAMSANRGNVTKASRVLGVHRNTLHNKLRTKTVLNGYVAALRPGKRGNGRTAAKKTGGTTTAGRRK
jgi:DNA-binding NtrC family response regulator